MSALLTAPYETRRILDKYGIHARKKYGQNFLIDGGVVDRIVKASGAGAEDCVLEIGPGIGTMTQVLSLAAGSVVAVEIDESLQPVLAETLDGCPNVKVLYQDILKTDLAGLAAEYNGGRPLKCVANLPYYITTPILLQLLEQHTCFSSITIMVQKEVAERITATEQDKAYGALSLAVRYYSIPEVCFIVPPHCFLPRPSVESAVLRLAIRQEAPVQTEEKLMFALIRAAFNQRRKTLANALSHGFAFEGSSVTREQITDILTAMGLPEDIRGEKLSLEAYGELARRVREKLGKKAG